jgi:hypothetical protein
MDHLLGRIRALLAQRGITAQDYAIRDDADGKRLCLTAWNATTLGPRPTSAELAAVSVSAATAQERLATIDRDTASDLVRAWLLLYLRDTLKRNPTAAERQAAMAAFKQAYQDVT